MTPVEIAEEVAWFDASTHVAGLVQDLSGEHCDVIRGNNGKTIVCISFIIDDDSSAPVVCFIPREHFTELGPERASQEVARRIKLIRSARNG